MDELMDGMVARSMDGRMDGNGVEERIAGRIVFRSTWLDG